MCRPTTQRRQKAEVPLPSQAAALAAQSPIANRRSPIPWWLMGVLLALGTLALYWPATRYDFVNLDDGLHVTSNVLVQKGLTWEGTKWVLLHPVANNWHPLTALSHMAVCQVCGLNPWGHHLVNVLLHALNAGLVFALLQLLTGAAWRSLLVAALFAFHPLRVESVAWVTERKDVLSGVFGLLALLTYARYVQGGQKSEARNPKPEGNPKSELRSPKPEARGRWSVVRGPWSVSSLPSSIFYLLSLCFLSLGLMSKPMLVTWPLVMLLLDYWPLRRMQNAAASNTSTLRIAVEDGQNATRNLQPATRPAPLYLLFEKIPFFALAALMSVVTFVVQQRGGALAAGEGLPLGARLGNALISYCRYLGKLFWPADLAVVYPHPGHWELVKVVVAAGLIAGISVLVWMQRRRHPFLLVGWLWYCGTLVPVSQVIQTGGHAMADRWTYIPSLGLLIFVIWGGYELARGWRYQAAALSVAGAAAIVFCLAMTRHQLGYWRDSEVLLRHTLEVTENNELAHRNLGVALYEKGQTDEAIRQFEESVRLKPDYAYSHYNLGIALDKQGQVDKALGQIQEALRLDPEYADAHYNLGVAFYQQGRTAEAIGQFRETIRLKPDHPEAHNNLGTALGLNGQTDEAIRHFQEALRLKPDYAEARTNLDILLATKAHQPPSSSGTTKP
jgi:protein O-mannosyl-transferase